MTGANKVWVTAGNPAGLPGRFLFPAVTRASELFRVGGTLATAAPLRSVIDLPADLAELAPAELPLVTRFLAEAEAAGAAGGASCGPPAASAFWVAASASGAKLPAGPASGTARPTSGVQRDAARKTGADTAVPPPSSPRSASRSTQRSRRPAGRSPGRKQVMAVVAAASVNAGTTGSSRWTDWPPSGPSSSERTSEP